jgi:hypothetical protein
MRELHAWHGDRRRHSPDATADGHVTRAHDPPNREVLRDLATRIAKHLEYRKVVEAAEARSPADQLKPKEARLEQAPAETRDKPAGKIAERRQPSEKQAEKQRRPERSRLPSDTTMQVTVGLTLFGSSLADAFKVSPGRWDAVAASFVGAVAAGVAWGNKRWKDKHGNRPEDRTVD